MPTSIRGHSIDAAIRNDDDMRRLLQGVAYKMAIYDRQLGIFDGFIDDPLTVPEAKPAPPPAAFTVTGVDGKFEIQITLPQDTQPQTVTLYQARFGLDFNRTRALIVHQLQSATTNDAAVAPSDVDATHENIVVNGPGGAGSNWNLYRNGSLISSYASATFTGKAYNTRYYLGFDVVTQLWTVSLSYKDTTGDNMVQFSVQTNTSNGAGGGTGGGGGGADGGTGGELGGRPGFGGIL